jgi:hypothetical protein
LVLGLFITNVFRIKSYGWDYLEEILGLDVKERIGEEVDGRVWK